MTRRVPAVQQFTKHFDRFVCEGDSITCTVDGIEYKARLEADLDSHIDDAECYTKRQIEAWRNDEWSFFGLVISASVDGVNLGDHLASLWAIEGNFPSRRKNPNKHFLEMANDLLGDAIPEALAEAQRIRSVLAKAA